MPNRIDCIGNILKRLALQDPDFATRSRKRDLQAYNYTDETSIQLMQRIKLLAEHGKAFRLLQQMQAVKRDGQTAPITLNQMQVEELDAAWMDDVLKAE